MTKATARTVAHQGFPTSDLNHLFRLSAAQRSEERYRRLSSLLVRLSQVEGLEPALDEVLTSAMGMLHADAGFIRLFEVPGFRLGDMPGDPTGHPFVVQRGYSKEYIDYFSSLPQPLDPEARAALMRGERRIIEDMTTHPTFKAHRSVVLEAGYVSAQATPMITRDGRAVGSIITSFVQRYTPPDEDLQLLDIYAKLAAATIESQERIAAQARTERALRDALAAKDEFLGLVSHELRTPMTVILGLSSILRRNQAITPDELGQTYDDLGHESERLHRLIENMLTLARVQAGRVLLLEPISINRFLEAYADTLREEIPGLVLSLNGSLRDRTVLGVERHLEQILQNLVGNAVKYSPRGTAIDVCVSEGGGCVQISVADRGIGLQDAEAVFTPFHREQGADGVAMGLGLGLAVCKVLVEVQGGRIWAESREGGGSTFTFTLPGAQETLD
ncbi:MAG: GAF domain-containing protein [Dehalococcoidia bacterium]|nr:GAF domain-containing protein [Dehalococcoidia bacterium]